MSELTDFELNKAIAEKLHPRLSVKRNCDDESIYVIDFPGQYSFFDYCNNWNDLMPLVLDNHIQMFVHTKDHYSIDDGDVGGFSKTAHKDKVARTYAECLLKVLEGERND